MRPERPVLCLVTDRRRLAGSDATFETARIRLGQLVREAVAAAIDLIQVRERDLETAQLVDLVSELVDIARGSASRIIVNDRADVALACGADGVHLRADSIAPAAGRGRRLQPDVRGESDAGRFSRRPIGAPACRSGRARAGSRLPDCGDGFSDRLQAGHRSPVGRDWPEPDGGRCPSADSGNRRRHPRARAGDCRRRRSGIAAIGLFLPSSTTLQDVASAVRAQFDERSVTKRPTSSTLAATLPRR